MPPWTPALDFTGAPRPTDRITEIVVHESVTTSHAATVRVLQRRGLSTHIVIDEHGTARLTCPLDQRALHCAGHNGPSIGIDLVSPYYPRNARAPWGPTIAAPWAHQGRYVLPTLAQVATLAEVIRHVHEAYGVPMGPVGIVRGRYRLGLMPDPEVRRAGVWAHHQAGSHADGAWPVLAAHLILQGGDPAEAYVEAVRLATGARGWVPLPAHVEAPSRCPCCGRVAA